MLSRFHTIPACHGQTDGRTELLYQYRASAAVCWRAIKTKDRPKTGFTFTAENGTTAESESSFSAKKTKRKRNFSVVFGRKRKRNCIFSKTLKNKWLLLIQHRSHHGIKMAYQSHRVAACIDIEIKREISSHKRRYIGQLLITGLNSCWQSFFLQAIYGRKRNEFGPKRKKRNYKTHLRPKTKLAETIKQNCNDL